MNGLEFADSKSTSSPATLRVAVRLLSGLAGLFAILDLAGWCFHLPALVGIFQHTVTMKPNTAISILFLAMVVWLTESEKHFAFLKGLLLSSVLVLATLTLLEYQTGHDFHIDQLFGHVSPDDAGDPVGRMAIGTALDVSLSASALLLLDVAPAFGILLASCAGLVAMSALIGTLFDAGPLLGVRLLRSMSVRTAGSFFVLQIAYFLLRRNGSRRVRCCEQRIIIAQVSGSSRAPARSPCCSVGRSPFFTEPANWRWSFLLRFWSYC